MKISVYCKVISFSNLFLHCCGKAGRGMISLDYCFNFQAGVVIMLVNINFMNPSISGWSYHRAPFCLKFCICIMLKFLNQQVNKSSDLM